MFSLFCSLCIFVFVCVTDCFNERVFRLTSMAYLVCCLISWVYFGCRGRVNGNAKNANVDDNVDVKKSGMKGRSGSVSVRSDVGCEVLGCDPRCNERPYVFRFCATKNLNSKKPWKKEKSACFLLEWNCCWLGSVGSSQSKRENDECWTGQCSRED